MSIVKDMSLAPSGHQKIQWVRDFMPALSGIEERFRREKPFEGLTIAVSVHLEAKTANLGYVLAKGGAEVRLTGSNPLSTQDDVAAAMADLGVETFGVHGVDMQGYEDLLVETLKCRPHLIVDDGGDLISLITADIEQLEVFYAHTISPVCIAILCVTGMTCFTASYHILPALVLLAGYLLVGIALPVWSARRGDKAAREYRQALADTNSYLLESLRGLRDILQYQNTAARAKGITAHSETLGEKQKAMKYHEGVTVGAANTLIVLTALAVLGVSIRLYQNGQLGAEGVLICTLSALSSFGPVVALANLGASLTQVFASADRVLDLLDEDPVTADVTDGADTTFTGAQAEHVSFAYAKEEVLHDLSLTIPEKKIVGITGRSGSGKSTFLRLLMRFWDVSSGTIRFGERDIRAVNTAALRAQESLVTQETELFDDTIENNIRIARRDATRAEVEAACRKAALDGFINSLPKGYDTPVGELGGALSGGERQRIGVARAFLHDAPFLLLDEPTSNLDSLNEGIILKAVRDECREKTVLLVSHRRSTMAVADLSFSVESGRLS